MKTRLTTLLGIERPIIQGGLAYIARAQLAAAVSNAGGLGQITATTLTDRQELIREINRVRSLTDKPFGVNFAMGHTPIDDLIDGALEAAVPVISLTGGNPAAYFPKIKQTTTRVMILVAGVRAAKKADALGADVIIAVGAEGGGHLGRDDTGTFVLVPRIVENVQAPVVASGGIGDGRGLLAALALGAEGIEMGTRFVATTESPAHPAYKEALIQTQENQTKVIERSIGRPGRALSSEHVDKILSIESQGATWETLFPYISGEANQRAALDGDFTQGFAWGGQVSGLIHDIVSVQTLLERMTQEADEGLSRLHRFWGREDRKF